MGTMRRILTFMLVGGVMVGVATAAPQRTQADLVTVAPRLVPKGSTVVAAQQMNAMFGIVAYRTPVRTGAFAVRWRGRWVKERAPGLAFTDLQPRRGQIVQRGTVLVSLRMRSAATIVRAGLWVDGQPVQPLSTSGGTNYLMDARPGRHTVAIFSATKTGAAATAWSFHAR